MMAPKPKKPNDPDGFVSKPGSTSYYFTWVVALGIWALIFLGIGKHAGGS